MIVQGDQHGQHKHDEIETPMEIRTPFPLRVKYHGLTLVGDPAGGKERNCLHEVIVRDADTQPINYLADAGYSERYGWRNDGSQWWVWTKEYPLDIAR